MEICPRKSYNFSRPFSRKKRISKIISLGIRKTFGQSVSTFPPNRLACSFSSVGSLFGVVGPGLPPGGTGMIVASGTGGRKGEKRNSRRADLDTDNGLA